MAYVATLIANPERPAVNDAAIAAVRTLAPGPDPVVLADGVAVDLPLREAVGDTRALAERLRAALAPKPIDVVVQPLANRRKALLVADMDSTMIGQECIDELADRAGVKAKVAAVTGRAMRGEIEFEPALKERVALLEGLPVGVIDDVIRDRIRPNPGARTLVATMRAHGAYTCVVTGGFTLFTQKLGALLGFDESRANTLIVRDGKLAGAVDPPILGREAKLAALEELTARLGLDRAETLAVGDGANDLPMIQAAGFGVAYHAKPVLAAAAAARIEHGDLTALLYLQGYRREEFADA